MPGIWLVVTEQWYYLLYKLGYYAGEAYNLHYLT